MNNLFWGFAIAFGLSMLATAVVRRIAFYFNITDKPDGQRKLHGREIPLMGGLAIFVAVFVVWGLFSLELVSGDLVYKHWLGVFIGACVLLLGGLLDDKYNLPPRWQLVWPALAALCVIGGGVGIEKISSPLGGLLYLDQWKIPMFASVYGWHYFVVVADIFTFIWLLGMMYTTKLLDGVDGLVSGVTAIGAFIIFAFTMTQQYYQPDIGFAALVLGAACLGFLVFNWNPASIFLGESGSLLAGFLLGVLAIISGGKIAVALLVMGIPILDVVWTIVRRLLAGKNPFRFADRQHLHFRLLDAGLGPKRTVLVYYILALSFGLSAVFLQSLGKFFALAFLVLIMAIFIVGFYRLDKRKNSELK